MFISFLTTATQQDLWNSVSWDDIDDIKQLYKEQCPRLYHWGLKTENSVLQLLAIDKKMKFDYLQTLIDVYNHYRITYNQLNPDRTYVSILVLCNYKLIMFLINSV